MLNIEQIIKEEISESELNDLKDFAYKYAEEHHEGFNSTDDAVEYLDWFINHIKDIKNPLILYRILFVDSVHGINKEELGKHFVNDKNLVYNISFMESIGFIRSDIENYNFFIATIETTTDNINWKDTIAARLDYPNENEFTLKNNANFKIIKMEKADKTKFR